MAISTVSPPCCALPTYTVTTMHAATAPINGRFNLTGNPSICCCRYLAHPSSCCIRVAAEIRLNASVLALLDRPRPAVVRLPVDLAVLFVAQVPDPGAILDSFGP